MYTYGLNTKLQPGSCVLRRRSVQQLIAADRSGDMVRIAAEGLRHERGDGDSGGAKGLCIYIFKNLCVMGIISVAVLFAL